MVRSSPARGVAAHGPDVRRAAALDRRAHARGELAQAHPFSRGPLSHYVLIRIQTCSKIHTIIAVYLHVYIDIGA